MKVQIRRSSQLLYFCIALVLSPIAPAHQASAQKPASPQTARTPLPIETATSALSFASTPISVSADGQWVAYVLKDPKRKEPQTQRSDQLRHFTRTGAPYGYPGCDVWTVNVKTKEATNVSKGQGTSWGPAWSPDGRYLAFYSDRRGKAHIWTWDKITGDLRQVSGVIVRSSETIVWTRDSKSVITKILPPSLRLQDENKPNTTASHSRRRGDLRKESQSRPKVLVYSSVPVQKDIDSASSKPSNLELPYWTNDLRTDIVLVDISNGGVKQIAEGFKPVGCSLSPDGTKIVFANPKRLDAPGSYTFLYDLVIVSLASRRAQVRSEFLPGVPSLPVGWSPDGTALSYVSDGECFILSTRGGEPRKAVKTDHPRFNGIPIWDATGKFIVLLGGKILWKISVIDGAVIPLLGDSERQVAGMIEQKGRPHALYVSTRNDQSKQEGFYKIDLTSGGVSKLAESNRSYNLLLSDASADGKYIVFSAQDSQNEANLWVTDATFSNLRQLTRINPQLEQYAMGASRLIEYQTTDGQKLRAAVLLPANYQQGKQYPLIVKVYGGVMLSSYLNQFGFAAFGNDNMQLLATRGYAVLLPDTPLRIGTPMKDLANTVLPAVDRLVELGIADSERLGIMGTSYGGYSTLALITQTTRFRAAHINAGLGDLISQYGVMLKSGALYGPGWAEAGQGRMGGTLWEFRDRYIENSPVFYLDRVETPLLITQGSLDVSPFLSDQIFVGLRRLGKEATYVKYEGEGHGIETYPNRIDYWNRVLTWFDSHLKSAGKTPPISRQ